MSNQDLTRRDFHRMTAAAFGGLVTGSVIGCAESKPTPPSPPAGAGTATGKPGDPALAKAEPHACRGLNTCASDKNTCAGTATCATVSHTCGGENTCKYLGGCGDNPGANECSGKGGCGVPMSHGDAWDRARKSFEARMKAQNKKFGDAPPKAEEKPAEKPVEKPADAPKDDAPKEDKPAEAETKDK